MGTSAIQRDTQLRQTPGGLVLPLPSPLLAMLPPELQGRSMSWFAQPLFFQNLLATKTATQTFQVDPSYVFAAWYGLASIRTADDQTDKSADPLTVSMTDSNNKFFNPNQTPNDLKNVFSTGGAGLPAVWPSPLIVPGATGINVTLTNLHAADNLNVRLTFMGMLIFVPR